MEIMRSLRKSWRLRKISKVLGEYASFTLYEMLESMLKEFQAGKAGQKDRHKAALEELLDLGEADSNVRLVMDEHDID